VADADDLLRKVKAASAEGYSAVRVVVEDRIANSIVRRLQEVQEELKSRACQAARATDVYVHENFWKSMGYVGVLGMMIGLLITHGRLLERAADWIRIWNWELTDTQIDRGKTAPRDRQGKNWRGTEGSTAPAMSCGAFHRGRRPLTQKKLAQ